MPTPSTQSIVLVDDERSYTDLLTQMLSEYFGCPIHAFSRPIDALTALARLNPAVIVTDYNMPQLTGLEFIRQAMPVVPAAAFVMITGHNLSAAEEEMKRLTALKGFLAKPFGWRKLADEILRVWPPGVPAPALRGSVVANR